MGPRPQHVHNVSLNNKKNYGKEEFKSKLVIFQD